MVRGGPARAPTARTVVWDTAAIPRDNHPPPCFGGTGTSHSHTKHHKRVIVWGLYQIADNFIFEFGPLPLER
jgi:hypothetical protein